ncbi:MAG: GYD domain-containing protein [Pirellulales bacterium]|nr:GYD domain-containing protein [Pirellulales bacterium]
MAAFVMIGKYSLDAMEGISAQRTDQAVALIAKYDGKLDAAYGLLGKYDLLLVTDFPDVQKAMKASVALSKSMAISFITSPAVDVAEFDKLMEGIG